MQTWYWKLLTVVVVAVLCCAAPLRAQPTPTATPGTPTGTATATDTANPTATDTPPVIAATATDTVAVATATDTVGAATATGTTTEAPTATVTGVPTGTATATATATGLPTGTATATATATGGEVATPTSTEAPTATATGGATATNTTGATSTATATTGGATATATNTTGATATETASIVPPPTNTATATRTGTTTSTPLPVDATIVVGSATGQAGSTVSVGVTLVTTVNVAGTQNDITFDPQARIAADEQGRPRCAVNPAIMREATQFAFQPAGCTAGTDCTGVRAIVLSFSNIEPIPSNSVLYTCQIEIAETATGSLPLTCSNPGASDADGNKIGADCTSGTITVGAVDTAHVVVGTATGAAGTTVPLSVSLQTAIAVARTQNDLAFPPQAEIAADGDNPACAVNAAINRTEATFAFQPAGCTPGSTCTGIRAIVGSAADTTAIPNGATLYTCQLAIHTDVADGTYPIACSGATANAPNGSAVNADCVDGEVIVGVQPTATATATGGTPEATATATATTTGSQSPNTPTSTPSIGTPGATATNTAAGPTRTNTRRTPAPSTEDDGCQVSGGAANGPAWLLVLPAVLIALRRRRRQ